MKISRVLLGGALLAINLGASAGDAVTTKSDRANVESLKVLSVAPCKPSGDGSFVEIATTMASVLPPAEADELLNRYCDECNKRKFGLSASR